jgi:hypothetical protein
MEDFERLAAIKEQMRAEVKTHQEMMIAIIYLILPAALGPGVLRSL